MHITSTCIRKTVTSLTVFLFSYACLLPAWGDSISQSAAEGNSVAKEAITAFSAPTLRDGNTFVFGSGGQTQEIKVQDLFPGVTTAVAPDLETAYGHDDSTLSLGGAANTRLSTEASNDGDAYRLLKGSAAMIRPNIKNDPLWSNTDNIMANQELFEKEFSDCKKESELKEVTLKKHIPDLKTCEKINKPAGSCQITHTVEIESEPTDMFFLVDNSGSMGGVIADLRTNVYRVAELLGAKSGDKFRVGGAVTRGNQYLSNNVNLTFNTLDFQNWINAQGTNSGQTYTFNAVSWAINNQTWRNDVNKVFVVIGNDDNGNGNSPAAALAAQGFQVFVFHNNGQIQSLGQTISDGFTAGGLFKVAQFLTVVRDRWDTPECIQSAKSTLDGFCTGEYHVSQGGTKCVNLAGFDVCPGDPIFKKLSEPPIPNVSKLATKIDVGAVSCPYNEGVMECFTDAQGVEQCPENSQDSCVITHSINLQEYPLVARVAVEDMIDVWESNRVLFDFVDGTYTNTSRASGIDGYVDKLNFDGVCKLGANGQFLPHKFSISSQNVWTGHKFAPNTLATAAVVIEQYPSCENGLKMVVNISDTSQGILGHFYAHEFNLKVIRMEAEKWGPDQCIAAAKKITDGTCESGSVTVSKGVTDGCLPVNGTSICPGDAMYNSMLPSPVAGIDKLALSVRVKGCMENNLKSNTCEEFENKGCGFISTQCIGNATGASGYCYVQEEVWDCGYDTDVKSAELESSYKCDGPIRCVGTECYNPTDEKSSDFAYAAAAMQITQFAENDLDCGDEATGSLACKVWTGEFMECKKALGGYVDCCEAPDGVSLMDYVSLTMNTLNAANKVGAFGQFAQQQGLWSFGEVVVEHGWQAVSSSMPWSTAADAATSLSQKLGESLITDTTSEFGTTSVIGVFQQQLMNYVAEWTATTFGPAAANAIFVSGTLAQGPTAATGSAAGGGATTVPFASTGADGAVSSASNATLGPMLSGILTGIMIAYMVYQIAVILIQIIFECEPEEYELGAKKETKLCHFVGSYCASKSPFGCIEKREAYCCFNSPLGRIIQEQARPQLGQDWGDVENPSCGGLTIEEIGKVDWSKIDISEWVGILNVTGHYPTVDGVSLNQLTGDGAFLSMEKGRDDTLERNQKRGEGMDIEQLRKEKEDLMRSAY
jgi:hypothetical protein